MLHLFPIVDLGYKRMLRSILPFAPWIRVLVIKKKNLYPDCCALCRVSWIIVDQYLCSKGPAEKQMILLSITNLLAFIEKWTCIHPTKMVGNQKKELILANVWFRSWLPIQSKVIAEMNLTKEPWVMFLDPFNCWLLNSILSRPMIKYKTS